MFQTGRHCPHHEDSQNSRITHESDAGSDRPGVAFALHFRRRRLQCFFQVKQRFCPDMKLVKKQIDTLIEKEYMKRSDDDKTCFDYVA